MNIPKENGATRPIGVSTVEDKIVQGAVRDVLEAVYEQDFLDCSYGFRPGRSAHDAIRELNGVIRSGNANYIVEADIVSFFDSIDRKVLMEMLRDRIADETLMRLVGKCLHVGILDGERYLEASEGTAQGSSLSPLRFAKFGLTLHPKKTRSFTFQPPRDGGGKGSASFDFLGFTVHWQRAQSGMWRVAFRTRSARLRRAIQAASDWCRRHRHKSIEEQRLALTRKLTGHYNYFGVNGNTRSLGLLLQQVKRVWRTWLNRRSQRARMHWKRFNELLKAHPLPTPRVCVQIWGAS